MINICFLGKSVLENLHIVMYDVHIVSLLMMKVAVMVLKSKKDLR